MTLESYQRYRHEQLAVVNEAGHRVWYNLERVPCHVRFLQSLSARNHPQSSHTRRSPPRPRRHSPKRTRDWSPGPSSRSSCPIDFRESKNRAGYGSEKRHFAAISSSQLNQSPDRLVYLSKNQSPTRTRHAATSSDSHYESQRSRYGYHPELYRSRSPSVQRRRYSPPPNQIQWWADLEKRNMERKE